GHLLDRQGVDIHVLGGVDIGAPTDVRGGVVTHAADVNAASDSAGPRGDAAGDRLDARVVGRRDVDALEGVDAGSIAVDVGAGADKGGGVRVDGRDRQAAGRADEAAAAGRRDVQHVLLRGGLDRDTAGRLCGEAAGGDLARDDAGQVGAVALAVDGSSGTDGGLGG